MTLILNNNQDLAKNRWTGNLVLSAKEEAPPEEFVEAMAAYAGLEQACRKKLQGTETQAADFIALDGDEGRAWQIDFPGRDQGVLCRFEDRPATGKSMVLIPRRLEAEGTYILKTYSGQVQPTLAPGDGKLQFPMVSKIVPLSDSGLPRSATGRELMEKGLTLKDGPGVTWITYQKRDK